jgi:hypothetical protein
MHQRSTLKLLVLLGAAALPACGSDGGDDPSGVPGTGGTSSAGTGGASATGGSSSGSSGSSGASSGSSGAGAGSGGASAGSSGSGTGGGSSGGGSGGAGGSAGTSVNGGAGLGQAGSFDTGGPKCGVEGGTGGPSGPTPALEPGVWVNITPNLQDFAGDPGSGSFGQGIAVDPCNPAILYFSLCNFDTNKGGIYKSTDGGMTWNKMGDIDAPLAIRIDPNNPDHLYAGSGVRGSTMGFWESEDGGVTWQKPEGWTSPGLFIDDVYEISVNPEDFNHVLVSSHSPWDWGDVAAGAGIMESRDGGDTWTPHPPVGPWGMGHGIWFLNNAQSWLLGTQDNGYWRTTDAGQNWEQVSTVNMAHGGGQVYITEAGVMYVSSGEGTLRSEDDGASWELVGNVTFTTAIYGDGNLLYTSQGYAGNIAPFSVSPEDDGMNWEPFRGGEQTFSNGPDEFAFDSVNGILYSSNWGDGLLALKVE